MKKKINFFYRITCRSWHPCRWADVKKINFRGATSTCLQVEVDVIKKLTTCRSWPLMWADVKKSTSTCHVEVDVKKKINFFYRITCRSWPLNFRKPTSTCLHVEVDLKKKSTSTIIYV